MKISAKISGAIATGVLMLSSFAPAALAADLEISDNGPFSHNTINVSTSSSTNVSQSNVSVVNTNINSTANTGGNNASFNNGGNVTINTGSAGNNTTVNVGGNSNSATVIGCGCNSTVNGTISGNGPFSISSIKVNKKWSWSVTQTNVSLVGTTVKNKANTGGNNASFNNGGNGGGSVDVSTGLAGNTTNVTVNGGTNTLIGP